MKNLGYIAGEITKGKNLSENLLKYGNGMCSMYNGLGFIKMSMNYYTVLDIARDLQNDKDLFKMINRLNELVERFVREFRMKQEPNPPMEALLGELKEQGYHLFLMSNTSHRFRAFSKNIPSVGYMDGIWISCECGYLKPEREAYVDFFRKMKIEPQESYFVDDSPANIEAGIRLGMRGCVYHQDMPELRRNLREAGIDLKDA